jgi:hypothetical protein
LSKEHDSMRKLISSGPLGVVGALLLGSAIACAPPPVDKGGGTSTGSSGGSTGSGTGGSGSSATGTGGSPSTSTGSGGSGSSSTGSGGSGSGPKGTGGSGSSSTGTGGSPSSSGTGGSKADAGGTSTPADMGGGSTPAAVTFSMVYDTILKPSCTPCHDTAHKNIILKDKAMALASLKMVVTPGDVAGSKLFPFIEGPARKMPKAPVAPLTADQVAKIKAWVMAGAKDD